ncbi:MAG: D-alanyl-D-alanine carboxypeptidase [Deltaproteobacteria bacterium]|nr:D-alanyl-D-alanine carboxypeptidase [Deltaproteobacteria bacterium]
MTTFASVPDPLPPALSSMKNLLEKEGVTFAGVPRPGTVPDTARLLFTHESRELSLIIRFLYRFSNNFTAEQIHKTLGAHAAGAPATREKGAQAIVDYLKKVGAYQAGLVNDDGSGLSRKNRISAQSLVDLLVHVANQPEIFSGVSGRDGDRRGGRDVVEPVSQHGAGAARPREDGISLRRDHARRLRLDDGGGALRVRDPHQRSAAEVIRS